MPGGTGKVVTFCQLVEQRPLQAQTRCCVIIALHAAAASLGAVLQGSPGPTALTEFVVYSDRQPPPDFLHINIKVRLLAGEIRNRVICGEGYPDLTVVAGSGADQLVLEARNRAACAQDDLTILAAGARDLLVANLPLGIDEQDVASFGRALDRLRLALLLSDPLDSLVDFLVRDFDSEALDAEIGEARLRDLRQHLDRHFVFEIGALVGRYDVDFRAAKLAAAGAR